MSERTQDLAVYKSKILMDSRGEVLYNNGSASCATNLYLRPNQNPTGESGGFGKDASNQFGQRSLVTVYYTTAIPLFRQYSILNKSLEFAGGAR